MLLSCVSGVLLLWAGAANAQQMQQMNHQQSAVIDGAVHPELISDLTAYRLWFLAVGRGPNPTAAEVKHQAAQLKRTLLSAEDQQALIPVLTTLKVQYQSLIQTFNEGAKAALAQNENPDYAALVLQRDQLVQTTRDSLGGLLTPTGLALLDAHIQSEKKHMHTSAPNAGGGQ
jgi:hypothetical protein